MIEDFEIMTNSVVPANASGVILAYDEKPNHTLTTLSHKGDADYQDGITLSFSIPVSIKVLKDLSKKEAKAIAFVALVRAYEHLTNKRQSYSINQLHELTKVHASTIVERLQTLEKMDLIAYDENGKILFLTIKSKHKGRNLTAVIKVGDKSLKRAENEIMSLRIVNKLRQIGHYRDVLTRYHEIRNSKKCFKGMTEEFKKLKRWLKGHCNTDYDNKEFVDRGWSYKNIARYLDTSIKTAVEIVKYAVNNLIICKSTKILFKRLLDSSQEYYEEHTFISHGYMYKVFANRYEEHYVSRTGDIRL